MYCTLISSVHLWHSRWCCVRVRRPTHMQVGSSGALYGLLAVLIVELCQSWQMLAVCGSCREAIWLWVPELTLVSALCARFCVQRCLPCFSKVKTTKHFSFSTTHISPRAQHPWREAIKIGISIFISLAIGTLPWVDNFAHLGVCSCVCLGRGRSRKQTHPLPLMLIAHRRVPVWPGVQRHLSAIHHVRYLG